MNLLEQLSQNEARCKCTTFLILFDPCKMHTSCPAYQLLPYMYYTPLQYWVVVHQYKFSLFDHNVLHYLLAQQQHMKKLNYKFIIKPTHYYYIFIRQNFEISWSASFLLHGFFTLKFATSHARNSNCSNIKKPSFSNFSTKGTLVK